METQTLNGGKTVLIKPTEELRSDTCEVLGKVLSERIAGETHDLILDLSQVTSLDSSGIGVLIRSMQEARSRNKRFLLADLHPNVRRVFRISNLYKVFDVHRSLEDAFFTLESHRVLIWETREAVREFYQEVLSASGFVIVMAASREEVVAVLEESPPSAIILDVLENEEPKVELVRRVRREMKMALPIIAISTYLEEEARYLGAGATLFVSKPFRVENLVVSLKDLIRVSSR